MFNPIWFKSALCGTASLMLTSCQNAPIDCFGYMPQQDSLKTSASGLINISIDGSGSMKGFAAANNSVYNRVIEELDPVLSVSPALNMAKTKTTIHRIGLEPAPSTKHVKDSLNSLLIARRPEVYEPLNSSPWKKVSSSIYKFVSQDPGALDVLISDLEPDDASIKQLLTAIKPKLTYEPNPKSWWPGRKAKLVGNQLAIIGIRSEFDGGVFPTVAGTFPSFPYKGIRPFYILLLGPVDKSELVIERLGLLKLGPDQLQISRFAANPSYGKTKFVDPSKTAVQPKDCFFPTFSISRGMSGKLRFDLDQKWIKLKKARQCSATQLQINYGVGSMVGFGSLMSTDTNLLDVTNALVQTINLAQNNTSIAVSTPLPPGSISLISTSIKAEQLDALKWQSWTMDPAQPDGAKTQRLSRLISNLRSETDLYSIAKFQIPYSPVRVCSAAQG